MCVVEHRRRVWAAYPENFFDRRPSEAWSIDFGHLSHLYDSRRTHEVVVFGAVCRSETHR